MDAKSTRWQYENGVKDLTLLDPTTWAVDQIGLDRPGNRDIQMDLMYDYRTNVALYPQWQKFLRDRQPKTLIFWGQDDVFFTPAGGEAFLRDLPKAELHRLAAGHFAVEDNLDYIANTMIQFYNEKVGPSA